MPVRSALELVTRPLAEPLSLDETKLHLRVDVTDDDELIKALIIAAREKAEQVTSRAFVSQVWRLRLNGFPYPGDRTPRDYFDSQTLADILLPMPPLRAVQSLIYSDASGVARTLVASDAVSPSTDGDFDIDYWSEPARLRPCYGKYWPTAKTSPSSVVVTFEAGYRYDDTSPINYAERVPQAARAAMKLMIGHWYQNREGVADRPMFEVPMAAMALLDTIKVPDFRLSQ